MQMQLCLQTLLTQCSNRDHKILVYLRGSPLASRNLARRVRRARAILTAIPLNCRDQRKRTSKVEEIENMHGSRKRRQRDGGCTWPNDPARCVSLEPTWLLLIFSFFSLSLSPSSPSPAPSLSCRRRRRD